MAKKHRRETGQLRGRIAGLKAAKDSVRVSGAPPGTVVTLLGDDKAIPPDQQIDLAIAGKAFPDGKPHFITRDADPMRAFTRTDDGMVHVMIPPEIRERLDALMHPGETDDDTVSRITREDGTPRYPKGTKEYEVGVALGKFIGRQPPLGDAPAPPPPLGIKQTNRLLHNTAGADASPFSADRVASHFSFNDKAIIGQKPPGQVRLENVLSSQKPFRREEVLDHVLKNHPSDSAVEKMADWRHKYRVGFGESIKSEIRTGDPLKVRAAIRTLLDSNIDYSPDERRQLEDALTKNDITLAISEIDSLIEGRHDFADPRTRRMVEGEKGITMEKALGLRDEIKSLGMDPKIGRVGESCFYKVVEAWKSRNILIPAMDDGKPIIKPDQVDSIATVLEAATPSIFLLQHDWTGAFSKAKDFEGGELKLPYQLCIFECRINGKRVFLMLADSLPDDPEPPHLSFFCETSIGYAWAGSAEFDRDTFGLLTTHCTLFEELEGTVKKLLAQVRAVCIALEAEVAETVITRAPHRLNQKRERAGKLPLYDYHTVDLAARKRYATRLPDPGDIEREHHHRRLHFVRGHWRHYENHKVYIKWHLRGDPDLGFVDKEYRL